MYLAKNLPPPPLPLHLLNTYLKARRKKNMSMFNVGSKALMFHKEQSEHHFLEQKLLSGLLEPLRRILKILFQLFFITLAVERNETCMVQNNGNRITKACALLRPLPAPPLQPLPSPQTLQTIPAPPPPPSPCRLAHITKRMGNVGKTAPRLSVGKFSNRE